MQKSLVFFFLILFTGMFACKKENKTATAVEVTVIDGATPLPGDIVNLYATAADVATGSPNYTLTTGQNGNVKVAVTYINQFYVIATKGSESNYYNGLIPVGIFASQADIKSCPVQVLIPAVGGVKFKDNNGDGAITTADDVLPPSVIVAADSNNTISTTRF